LDRQTRDDGAIVYEARAPWTPKLVAVASVVVGVVTGIVTRLAGAGIVAAIGMAWLSWVVAPRVVVRVDSSARRIVRSYVGRILLDVPFDAVQNVAARRLDVSTAGYHDRLGRKYTAAVLEIGTSDEDITLDPLETEKQAIEEAKELARTFALEEAPAEAPLLWLAVRKSRSP
jgi:hypothetical protein